MHLRPTDASILMNDLLPQEGKRKEFNLIPYVLKIEIVKQNLLQVSYEEHAFTHATYPI